MSSDTDDDLAGRLRSLADYYKLHPGTADLLTEAADTFERDHAIVVDLARLDSTNPYDGDRCVFCGDTKRHAGDCIWMAERIAAARRDEG